ncbi:MAG TPA: hypothetical protein VMX13_09400 [Sedimentisphaerales bacterium]|nr:hypothetical protein [Sedimentisphaerales bacterium]
MKSLRDGYLLLCLVATIILVATERPCVAELVPSLENYVERCVLIVKARTIFEKDGRLTFRVLETWKGKYCPEDFVEATEDGRFFADGPTSAGSVADGQEIVLFFTWRNQRVKGKLSSFSTSLPIRNGRLIYGETGDPPSFPREYTVEEFEKQIRELGGKRQIPVVVRGWIKPVLQGRELISLKILIFNGLRCSVHHGAFTTKPSAWNGETGNISVFDIYRDDDPLSLYLERPQIKVPDDVAGINRCEIKPGENLLIETDVRKWKIRGGWIPGRYKLTIRVDNLTVDDYCTISVMSDPIVFEIR